MTILVPKHGPKNVITNQNSKERVGCIWKNLRQRLLETCKATADFAIFSGFGWHRRGDPLKSEKNILSKVAILGWENSLSLDLVKYFEFSRCFSLKIYLSLIRLSQIWQQAEVSCAISGLYNLCFKIIQSNHFSFYCLSKLGFSKERLQFSQACVSSLGSRCLKKRETKVA